MKKLAFVVFALLLFFPGSLFAKSSKLWSVELEKSWSEAQLYKDGWQYTWRIHRQIVQSRNSRFSFRIGLMLVPDPPGWVADATSHYHTFPDGAVKEAYPIFAAGLSITNTLHIPLGISLALEPRVFVEWADWERSSCGGLCDPVLPITITTGSGWALVSGLFATVKMDLPFHLTIGAEAGFEINTYDVSLSGGRPYMPRTGLMIGFRF